MTINEVAAEAGVSIKTVSRVLNREPNVREDTRKRVLAAAEALRYRPSQSARSLAGSRSFLICLLYDNPSPAYVSDVQQGAVSRCREAGYHLIVEPIDSHAPDLARTVEATISTLQVDGVILTPPVSDNVEVLDVLERLGAAYVRIAPDRSPERAASVGMDDRRAAYDMTAHLIGLGHRDIGFIKGHPEHGAAHLRFDGFAAAMQDHGLEVEPSRVAQGWFSFRSGLEAADKLLSPATRPTALFASNDDMALGAIAVASRLGLRVPQDLSIVGFDNTPSAITAWPPLTTVRQPIVEMAAAAAALLLNGEAAAKGSTGQPPHRMLDFEIVTRESAAPPPG